MKRVFIFSAACALFFASCSPFVFAHNTGVSYTETKDGYKIDIGHDQFITAGQPARFDYLLYPADASSTDGIFTDVWVTITDSDKKLLFAGGISKPTFGSTGFTYVFPKEGTYTISSRYQKDGDTVVSTEFPIQALQSTDPQGVNPVILYVLLSLAGLVIGMAIGLFIPRKEKNDGV